MKKIKKIAIVFSGTRKTDKALSEAKEIIFQANSDLVCSVNVNKIKAVDKNKISKADLILVFGGDGTMIGSVRSLHSLNIPFLGVNSGTVGFLTDLSISKIDGLADILKDKDYKFLVKGFTVDTNKNYMSLVEHGGIVSLDKKSKTEDLFFINRKSLKIYDPIKKVNLGQCNSNENKI